TAGTDVAPALGFPRGQGLEDRRESLDRSRITANHQAIPFSQAPDSAAGSDIDEVEALRADHRAAAHRVLVVAVASINDRVTLFQQAGQGFDRVFGRLT